MDISLTTPLSLDEFCSAWRAGNVRAKSRKRGEFVVPFDPRLEKEVRKVIRMIEHYTLEGNDELRDVVKAFLRKSPRMSLKSWLSILYHVKVLWTPYRGAPINVLSGAAVGQATREYIGASATVGVKSD